MSENYVTCNMIVDKASVTLCNIHSFEELLYTIYSNLTGPWTFVYSIPIKFNLRSFSNSKTIKFRCSLKFFQTLKEHNLYSPGITSRLHHYET